MSYTARGSAFVMSGSTPAPYSSTRLIRLLTDPKGLYVLNQGKATRYTNTVYTFYSATDPSIYFSCYDQVF